MKIMRYNKIREKNKLIFIILIFALPRAVEELHCLIFPEF